MSKPNYLAIAICLLSGWMCCHAVGTANDQATGQIIGLCYRDGSKDIVWEEVFHTEGVPYARLHDLSRLAQSDLKGLVLGEGFEDSAEEIKGFLEKGGAVLCLKPSAGLAEALGLKRVGAEKHSYLAVKGHGASLISYAGRLQLFGEANHYEGGETLAWLSPEERFGGIIRVKRGSGTALAAAFDLPATLLRILQPESECGKVTDASNVEYDLGDAPQVDLMRRLLVGLLLDAIDVPVMRKWYFPAQHRAMLIVLGDQDGANFEQLNVVLGLMKELETPYTLYVTPAHQPVTKEQFKVLAEGGMEFALHPDFFKHGDCRFNEKEFQEELEKAKTDVGYPILGERTHSCRWDSFRETPTWAERAGLQYDAILGTRWWESKAAKCGYWQGTGLPYRFIDPETAKRLDFLEIPVAGIDNEDFWKPRKYTVAYKPGAHKTFLGGLGLTEEEGFERSKRYLDQALEKYPTAYGYCWHPRYLAAKKLQLKGSNANSSDTTDTHFRKCINYAKSRGAGLIGTNALNDFWRAREKVLLKNIAWNPDSATMQYRVSSEVKVSSLTFVTPLWFHGKKAGIFVNGQPKNCTEADLFGGQQAMLTVGVGPEELLITVRYD